MITIEDRVENLRERLNTALELYKSDNKTGAAMAMDEVAEAACEARDEIDEEITPEEWEAAMEKKISDEPKAKA